MNQFVEYVGSYAIILRKEFRENGIHFVTPGDYSQQLGYMKRPDGYRVMPHKHNEVKREVTRTQEVLFVRAGKLRVDLFDSEDDFFATRWLHAGDVILLSGGGHSFTFFDNAEVIEVKQGPYSGDKDKTYL